MDHLVIDLEMCKIPKHYRTNDYNYSFEIIQIGAVILDKDWKQKETMSLHVHPEHGIVDHFIADLTGIHNYQLKNALLLKDALNELMLWIGDREYNIFAWSGSDYSQLEHEMAAKSIDSEVLQTFMEKDRWVDYQDIFSKRFGFRRKISLEEALDKVEIDPKGRAHDGLDDAINTGTLIRKLELDPDFTIPEYISPDSSAGTLTSSLGDLFAGLKL